MRLKLSNFGQLETVGQALKIATSRQGIRQVFSVPLYANSIYLLLSTVVMDLVGFFFWLIVARFYSEVVVGYSSAIISVLNLFAIFSLVGLNISLVRFLPQTDKPARLINTCFTVSSLVSLMAATVFLVELNLWSPALLFVRENPIFCAAFLVFAILWSVSLMVNSAFLASRNTFFTFVKSTIFSLLRLPLPLLLASFFRTFGVVVSWGIALSVALAVSVLVFLPRLQPGYRPVPALHPAVLRGRWGYALGNYLANLLTAAPGYLLPLMVVNILGPEQNAHFYVAWMMAQLLFAVPQATSSSLFAEGSHFEERLGEHLRKSLRSTFVLLVPAAALLAAAGRWLLLAFGQGYSSDALTLLWILCLSSLPCSLVHLYTARLRLTDRTRELVAIWGYIALSTLLVSYLLLPRVGITAIGYAWMGAQAAATAYILSGRRLAPP